MRKIAEGETAQVPVAKVISKRAERKVHYEDQSEEVTGWLETVQKNRQAETLDFRPKERMEVTKGSLVEKFVPTTDFEKAVHAALQQAGQQDEEAILKAEEAAFLAQQDDLGGNEQTMEEYKQRRAQLAKMRALMFYHEQKRHRINKIKSKKYRRIRKKQREKAKASELEAEAQENPELLRDLEEKEEVERMKERMTLAHKNTSKWAKRILKRGKNVDPDTRKALSAQLKRGDDLRQKMNATQKGDDSDLSESEDLAESARKVLEDTDSANNDEQSEGKGLFKLKFMQKGIEKQREKAKEEARQLLRELEANEKLDDYDEAIMYDSDDEEKAKKKRQVASKEDMKNVMKDGELVASSLKFGKSKAVSMSGGINIDLGTPSDEKTSHSGVSEHSTTLEFENSGNGDNDQDSKESPKAPKKQKQSPTPKGNKSTVEDAEEINPWVSQASHDDEVESSKKRKTSSTPLKTGVVDVDRVLDVLDGDDKKQHAINDTGKASGAKKEESKNITSLSQEELVRRAFATSDDREIEEEFANEKADVEAEENDTKTAAQRKKEKEMEVVSGWGSWAGAGVPPPKPPKKLPKKLQPPPKKETKRKRQDAKNPNVIIREKRLKKTAKFMVDSIPYPFKTREEYERAMLGPVGREWNVTNSFKDMSRPEIQTRIGKVIQPLSQKEKKNRRAPAKF
jgi:U3 small nucleolar RNA-associated protein 14